MNRRATYFTSMPVLAAPVDLGRTIVAWPDTDGQIHFSFVTSLGRREHDDVKVQGDSVHGLAAVGTDGGAALVRNNTQMLLVRFKTDGTVPWKTVVVGDGTAVGSDVFVGSGVLVGGGAVCAAGISRRSACRMTRDK